MSFADSPVFKKEIIIQAPVKKVWEALITPSIVKKYHLAPLLKIELKEGGEIIYGVGKEVMISGRITEFDSGVSFSHTFRFGPESHEGTEKDQDTLVTYTVKEKSGSAILTIEHSGFDSKNQTYANVTGGWPMILDGLKKTLEAK